MAVGFSSNDINIIAPYSPVSQKPVHFPITAINTLDLHLPLSIRGVHQYKAVAMFDLLSHSREPHVLSS